MFQEMGSDYQPNETRAILQSVDSWRSDMCEVLESMEEERLCLQSDLTTERSFRKVWGAGILLSFLYGLVYGVYFSK